MRTVLLANGRLGARVADYLAGRDELSGLVLHPPQRRKGFENTDLNSWTWPDGRAQVRGLQPECLLSVMFGYLIPEEWLAIASWSALNLHPGLLPYNRGANSNVWPLVDGTPAGTTLHRMDETFDTGPILAQRRVNVFPDDTAQSLYERLEDASMALFQNVWPNAVDLSPQPQEGAGSYHRSADLSELDIVPEEFPVIDKLRARTFFPYGAEFSRDGRRFRARIEIEALDE